MTERPSHAPGTVPWWRADRLAQRRTRLRQRGLIVDALRALLRALDMVEVETPILQVSPGLEPHLQAFATDIDDPGLGARRLYLHTSPEFAMKKLLAGGEPRLFQLARVFRNAERSATHHPEFTMLEWYRAGADTDAIVRDCVDLVRAAALAAGADRLVWRGVASDPFGAWQMLTVDEAFATHAGIDLQATIDDALNPAPDALAERARALGLTVPADDRWDDVFFRIFLDRIEPKLGHPRPTILRDYPISMAALARAKPGARHLADRFEVYIAGLELANAFGELTDAGEQRRRFRADMDLKQALYGTRYPIDEDFLAALDPGRDGGLVDPTSGIALGVDRLVMLATGAERIEDVLWAPVAPPDSPG